MDFFFESAGVWSYIALSFVAGRIPVILDFNDVLSGGVGVVFWALGVQQYLFCSVPVSLEAVLGGFFLNARGNIDILRVDVVSGVLGTFETASCWHDHR